MDEAIKCDKCGIVVKEGGKILINPLVGFLVYCKSCYEKEKMILEKESEMV